MRVLQINSVCGVGSTGRIAVDIHNLIKSQGFESWIAFGREKPINCENTIKIGTKWDNYIHVLKSRLLDRHGFGSKKATKNFVREIRKLDPDVIHLHNIHGYYLNVKILFDYLISSNKPIIWTLHDCWTFTGHCAYYDFVGCVKWKKQCYNCPQKKNYPSSVLLDQTKRNQIEKIKLFNSLDNLTIVTPSKWLANEVEKSKLNPNNIEVINNGIDLNVFKPSKSDFRKRHELEDKFVILGVASPWVERKGLKYFVELSQQLSDEEVIVLVGLDERQIKQMPKNIIGINKTNNVRELTEIYSTADVFVNPTLEDNFPTTNLEALACGTPVITFDTGGSVESLDEETGSIAKLGDVADLLKKIRTFKNIDKVETSALCVNRALQNYNKENKYLEYLMIYKKLNE